MQKNRIRGPVITLAAVAALGGGLWWSNASQQVEPAAGSAPAVVTTVNDAPKPPAPSKVPAPVQFPATAAYSGVITTRNGTITVDITVNGDNAVAYACDVNSFEVWMRGEATNGALALADRDGGARLSGRSRGDAVEGTLWVGERKWDFTAPAVPNAAPVAG